MQPLFCINGAGGNTIVALPACAGPGFALLLRISKRYCGASTPIPNACHLVISYDANQKHNKLHGYIFCNNQCFILCKHRMPITIGPILMTM